MNPKEGEQAAPPEVESTEGVNPDVSVLLKQVDCGFKRRNKDECMKVFTAYKSDSGLLSKHKMKDAMQELGVRATSLDIDEIFRFMDTSGDGLLSADEFIHGCQRPFFLEQWSDKIPLTKLLSDVIPSCSSEDDPLRTVSQLAPKDIDVVGDAFLVGFKRMLQEEVQKLKTCYESVDRKKAIQKEKGGKFDVITMSCGGIHDFHSGLAGRVGQPHLDFDLAVEAEHCSCAGHSMPFTTSNYGITTTPKEEWDIIVNRKPTENLGHDRQVLDIDELMQSEIVKGGDLSRIEVIVLVLYTGPMYMVYNAILRQWPRDLYEAFAAGENLYPSTIHALVSAVHKMARLVKLPEGLCLYRGLGGKMELPPGFYKSDPNGCRGFAEWGFMSTTSHKEVALMYSGVQQGRPLAMVFEVQVGSVDRGACIRDFSQYPQEVEYLWVPCSFLEPQGTDYVEVTEWGPVSVIPVRVNANLKTLLIEELIGQKKDIHMTGLKYMMGELDNWVTELMSTEKAKARYKMDRWTGGITLKDFAQGIIDEAQQLATRQSSLDPKDFTDSEVFQRLVIETLDMQKMAKSKALLWLNDDSRQLSRTHTMRIREAFRYFDLYNEMYLTQEAKADEIPVAALALCKSKGLVHQHVNEQNDLGECPIITAAAVGETLKSLKFLTQAGANVESWSQPTSQGTTLQRYNPMQVAARFGHSDTVSALHELGASVAASSRGGGSTTAVMEAARNGQTATVEVLACLGADIKLQDFWGGSALSFAALGGYEDTVIALCRLGADVNVTDMGGLTPLHHAAQSGHETLVTILLAEGSEANAVDNCGWTPLMQAARRGHASTVSVLQSLGADLARESKNGATALMSAARAGHTDVVDLLETLGLEVSDDIRGIMTANTSKADAGVVLCTSRYNPQYYCNILSYRLERTVKEGGSVDTTIVLEFAVYGDGSMGALQGAHFSRLWVADKRCSLRQVAIFDESATEITGTLYYEAPDHGDEPKVLFAYGKTGYKQAEVPTSQPTLSANGDAPSPPTEAA